VRSRQRRAARRPCTPVGNALLLSSTRDEQLVERARRGDRAASRLLVERHLPLVRHLASDYADLGLPFDDLVQEGSIGLLDAIDRFDPKRGAAFSTFAYWCIRKTITHALTNKGHLIRVPKRLLERRHLVAVASSKLAPANGHEPSSSELAAATGLEPEAVTEALQVPLTVTSLDQVIGDEGLTQAMLLADPTARDPADEALTHELKEVVAEAVAHLPADEQVVVRRHYGLEGEPERLAEIADELGYTSQKTRAIKDRALFHLARALKPASLPLGATKRVASTVRFRTATGTRVGAFLALLLAKASSLLEHADVSPPL
jgi:RNA polymerase sigma factor (sigma-70 family)